MLTRKAVAEDIPRLGSTLGSAFAEDPIVKWIFPGAGTRTRVLPAFFSFQIRHLYLPHNEVYTTEDLLAAALWLPPGNRARVCLDRPTRHTARPAFTPSGKGASSDTSTPEHA
jgi:hypothetical protein